MMNFLALLGIAVGGLLQVSSAIPWGIWEGTLIDSVPEWTVTLVGRNFALNLLSLSLYFVGFTVFMISANELFGRGKILFILLGVMAAVWEAFGLFYAVRVAGDASLTLQAMFYALVVLVGCFLLVIGMYGLASALGVE